MKKWGLLSSHGAALVYISKHPHIAAVDIGQAIGLRERNTVRTINDLVAEGYVKKELVDRVNRYQVNTDMPLRRPMMVNTTVADFLKAILPLLEEEG